ncbi:unnamed protein product [Protopolystoma xenopodis]|uniref:Uncharacterized protein n=1 Tax=Protopolystoma xenopodis TaxID=117903 RepID=A0A448WBS3_9PLAT|nr:unnamed protein product [Protopolystoma xenopodis]
MLVGKGKRSEDGLLGTVTKRVLDPCSKSQHATGTGHGAVPTPTLVRCSLFADSLEMPVQASSQAKGTPPLFLDHSRPLCHPQICTQRKVQLLMPPTVRQVNLVNGRHQVDFEQSINCLEMDTCSVYSVPFTFQICSCNLIAQAYAVFNMPQACI